MPKCVVIDPDFDWRASRAPSGALGRTIIYETHVRGYTMLHPDVPRGTARHLRRAGRSEVVDYIKSLGVTSVELLPIHTFIDDSYLLDKGLINYWGYNSIGFFAPDPRYFADRERPARVQGDGRPPPRAGLEVILDVVYNHTAEGNELGPTLSFKGIDNASYYRLMPDQPRYYINDTGTGNTLNLSHPRVHADGHRQPALLGRARCDVDGFRFDLGTILAREPDGFDEQHGFLKACLQDPVLRRVKLIAEPWDCGPGGYQVGGFPPGWAEWNDNFRDTVRDFWKGDQGNAGDFARRLTGSADKFGQNSPRLTGSNDDILEQLEELGTGNELATAGVARLRDVVQLANAVPNQQGTVQIDASIARGLDYYTGTVLETTLDDLPDRQHLQRRPLR